MKKIILFMTMMVGVLTAHADSYTFLTFVSLSSYTGGGGGPGGGGPGGPGWH